ncbi:MAG: hypothetical protein EZS28_000351 [Streblomastix strix]|uniref:Uncharacterized protein n=1 Tax=Streblomastix strix TaxID=222440 RepID=A0A5J4XAJ0_9EUKA|nr:MAG: hypothetical protein EZS28_000351 [Streblomastix strix]
MARNTHTVMKNYIELEGRDKNPPPPEAQINQASVLVNQMLINFILDQENDKLKQKKQFLDSPEARSSQLQNGESFGKSLTQILQQMLQDYNLLIQTQNCKVKTKIKVMPFGIIQEMEKNKMIDQIQEEITRIFKNKYKIGVISDHKIVGKEVKEENSDKQITEEIEPVKTEITDLQTHIIIVISTIYLMSLDGLQPRQYRQLLRTQQFQTLPKDKLVFLLHNWQELPTLGNLIKLKFPNNNQNNLVLLKVLQANLSPKPSISTSQSSETSSSNIIPISTPYVHQVQQEQDHLLHSPVAVSFPPINPSNIIQLSVVNTQHNDMLQPILKTLDKAIPINQQG